MGLDYEELVSTAVRDSFVDIISSLPILFRNDHEVTLGLVRLFWYVKCGTHLIQ